MSDSSERLQRHQARWAAIDKAVADTAKEHGITAGGVRWLWHHASRDGADVRTMASGPFVDRRAKDHPGGVTYVRRCGLLGAARTVPDMFWRVIVSDVTPKGRGVLWALHVRLAAISQP